MKEKTANRSSTPQKAALVLFGVLLALALLEVGMRAAGAVYLAVQEGANTRSMDAGAYGILCLGESTTAMGFENSYPRQLEQALNKGRAGGRFAVINKGVPGTTTGYIVTHLAEYLRRYKPRMVVAMMGINDRDGGNFAASKSRRSRQDLRSLRVYKLFSLINEGLRRRINSQERYTVFHQSTGRGNKDFFTHYIKLECNTVERSEELRRALEREPDNEWLYVALSHCYDDVKSGPWSPEVLLKKALQINPHNDWAHAELGKRFFKKKAYAQALRHLKRSILEQPWNTITYGMVMDIYLTLEQPRQAEQFFEQVIRKFPKSDVAYRRLASLYKIMGSADRAREYSRRAEEVSLANINPETRHNFKLLRDMVLGQGLKLVLVQYPVRSVNPLKAMAGNDPRIIYVDNERLFKDALQRLDQNDLFEDMFAGDFGHCTPRGNRMLAQSVARAIQGHLKRESGRKAR